MSYTVSLGQLARLQTEFLVGGALADPYSILPVDVIDSFGVVKSTISPIKSETGRFYVDYFVPATEIDGNWVYRWTWVESENGVTQTKDIDFVVAPVIASAEYVQHNFVGLGGGRNIFAGTDSTAITMKGVSKRVKIFFTLANVPFNPEIINLLVQYGSNTSYSGSLGGGTVIKAEDGSYYADLPASLFLTAPRNYTLTWTYQATVDSELVSAVAYLFVLHLGTYSWFPRLRLQVDKSMKIVNNNFIGFTDAQLFYYLQGGLDEINFYPPVTSLQLGSFPATFGQLLVDSATVVALHSQGMFSIDTDAGIYSDQGFSYTVDHFSKLNTVLDGLLVGIRESLSRVKLQFYNGGSITVQVVPYYPLGIALSVSPSQSLFRNLFSSG